MKKGRRKPGKRHDRETRVGIRTPELGYYLIVTDTNETERNYFLGLRDSLPEAVKGHIVIKVEKAKTTYKLIDNTIDLIQKSSQLCIPWIVFDRDEVKEFDTMIAEAQNCGIHVGWSSPCFEIWFMAYFGSMPVFQTSQECCKGFERIFAQRTSKKYEKNLSTIYSLLVNFGDSDNAIQIAEGKYKQEIIDQNRKPSESQAVTTVYMLVDEILKKTKVW